MQQSTCAEVVRQNSQAHFLVSENLKIWSCAILFLSPSSNIRRLDIIKLGRRIKARPNPDKQYSLIIKRRLRARAAFLTLESVDFRLDSSVEGNQFSFTTLTAKSGNSFVRNWARRFWDIPRRST